MQVTIALTWRQQMTLTAGDFTGAVITDIKINKGFSVEITTDKGIIAVREGDCGTMRNPEPYFEYQFLPLKHCKRWVFFGICGNKLPCKIHDKIKEVGVL